MPMKFKALAPVFLVEDVVRAAEHYHDRMGFEMTSYFGNPPEFTIVQRAEVRIALRRCCGVRGGSNRKYLDDAIDAYVWIEGINDFYRDLKERGASVAGPPALRVYGIREIEVRDADGYIICFGEFAASQSFSKNA